MVQRCHWENDYAQDLGQPAAYDYGMMRTNWMVQLLTNWMGDYSWLYRLSTQIRRFNYVGDTHWVRGQVVAVDASACPPSVEITMEAVNQRGETTCAGEATVLVCADDGTPPMIPEPSGHEFDPCPCSESRETVSA
jgi:hypothetical protein